MAVIKLSSTGKSLQFIDEMGNVFQLSMSLFQKIVSKQINGDFVVLTRMPLGVPVGRFPVSPVYGDGKIDAAVSNAGNNAFSKEFLQERKEQQSGTKASEYKVKW